MGAQSTRSLAHAQRLAI